MFKKKMETEAIPERVYALCKNVELAKSISINDLRNKMEPTGLNESTTYFPIYRETAEELFLIMVADNIVSLGVEANVLQTIQSMRKYINTQLERFSDGPFYQVTRAYFRRGVEILHGEQNVGQILPSIRPDLSVDVNTEAMRGWRFWAEFLGFGIRTSDMFIMPNAYEFILDLINNSNAEVGKRYAISDFVNLLRPHINIVVDPSDMSKTFNFGVSGALRLLHDFGVIRMEYMLDDKDRWTLYKMPVHEIPEEVSQVTVIKKGEIQ